MRDSRDRQARHDLSLNVWAREPVNHVSAFGDLPFGQGAMTAGRRDDTIVGTADGDRLFGKGGDDRVRGGGGDDVLNGGGGDDRLSGGSGDDVLVDGTGNDFIDGGPGQDTLSFANSADYHYIQLSISVQEPVSGEQDTILNVENLIGGRAGDLLYGNDGANVIRGGGGVDSIEGGGGDDRLIGGEDNDFIYGNAGADTFVFESRSDFRNPEFETINDFSRKEGDHIDLSAMDSDETMRGTQAFVFGETLTVSLDANFNQVVTGLVHTALGDRTFGFTVYATVPLQASDFIL